MITESRPLARWIVLDLKSYLWCAEFNLAFASDAIVSLEIDDG
jgi:hypothetical protein